MAIIGSAEVEVRADVRKLGKDVTDSFKGLEKQADEIADRMGKSIADSLRDNLDGLTLQVDIDQDYFLDQARQVEDTMGVLSDEAVNIKVEVDADEILDLAVLLEDLSGTVQLDIDQDHFSRQVLFAEDTLGNLMDSEVPVTITADTDSLLRLADDVRNIVDSIPESSRTVKYEPKLADGAQSTIEREFSGALDQARAAADNFDFEIPVRADVDTAREKLEELRRKIEDDEIQIGITYSQADLEQLNAAIETLRQVNEANAIDLEVDMHISKALAEIAVLTRDRRLKIIPEIGNKFIAESAKIFAGMTGLNVMRDHFRTFIESLTQLDKKLGVTAMQLAGLSAVVPAAGALGGWAVTMVGDLAQLTGLLVPFSGILGGGIIAGSAFALAMVDVGERFKDLSDEFKAFQEQVAGNFWGEAEEGFRSMVEYVLPSLQVYMDQAGRATGRFADSLFDAVTAIAASDRGTSQFGEIVDNLEVGLDNLGPAWQPFLEGLLAVSTAGSRFLPELGTYLTELSTAFGDWANTNLDNGNLERWGRQGIDALKELISIVGSTVGIIKTLYGVASRAGFPGLTEFADGLESINQSLAEPANVAILDGIATSVMNAMGSMSEGLGWVVPLIKEHAFGIGNTIETMGRIVGEVFSGIGSMLTDTGLVEAFFGLFDSMESALIAFRPAWESLGTIFEVTLIAIGSALENLAPVFAVFFENLATDAQLIKPALMGVLDIVGEWGPRVMEVVGVVTNAIAGFIGNLNPYIILLGAAFMASLPALAAVGGAFSVLWGIGTKFVGIADDILGMFGRVGPSAAGLGGTISGLGGAFGKVLGALRFLTGPIGWVIGAFIAAFAASEDLRKAVGDFLVNAFKAVAAFIEPLIGPIMELFGVIGQISSEIGAVLAPAFESLFGVLNALWPIVQLVAKVIGEALGASITVFVGILKGAWDIISNVLGGAVTLISGVFDGVAGIIEGIIDLIVGWFTGNDTLVVDGLKQMFDGVLQIGESLFQGVAEMVMGALTGIVEFIQEFGTGIMEAFKGVLDGFGLSDAGLAIIDSLIEGFQNGLQAVIDWLVGLTQAIIDSKGPPEKDATLLTSAGESIINSLIQGFKNAVAAVFSFLQGLTQQIVDVVMNVVNAVIGFFQTGWSMLVSVVQTVWNGIVTVIQTVLTTVMTVVQFYVNLVVTFFQNGWTLLTTVVQTVWNGIVTVIQTVLTTVMTVVQFYVNLVVTFFQNGWALLTTVVQTVWNGIVNVIRTVLTMVMTVVQFYINLVVTIFQTGWTVLVTVVQTVWNAIITVIQTVWLIIQTAVQTGLNFVKMIFTTVWNAIVLVVQTVWNTIITAVRVAITTVQTVITTVMNFIRTIITTVWNAIKLAITTVVNAIRTVITTVFNVIRTVITSIMNTVRTVITSVWNAIRSAVTSVVNTIRSIITSVFNAIRSLISSVMNSIRSTISSVWNTIRSVITSAVNAVRSIVSSVFNAIRSLISSVMSSIRSTISSVWSSIRSTISNAVNAVRSAVSNGFNALRGIVTNAWNAVVSAVRSAIGRLMSLVGSIPGKIKGALGNLGGLLRGAGRSIIQGLIDGVSGMIGSLRDKFSGITNMIPDWKGPPDTDAKLLTNAGELIMEGLISGLESKYGAVKNSLQSFTGDLSQTVRTNVGADIGLSTSVRRTALSDAERRLAYRSNANSMVESNRGMDREVHLHFHNALVNESEIITVVNRELGRGV